MAYSDLDDFRLRSGDFSYFGEGLQRPEYVLAAASGAVYASDTRRGVVRLSPDGTHTLIGGNPTDTYRFKPNGFVLQRDGGVVFANLGKDGGLWHISPTGDLSPFLTYVDGIALPTVNFVWMDLDERIWFCVSSLRPRETPFSTTEADGFVGLIDSMGARIVADGLIWTNECRIDPTGEYFYVNETFGRRTTRFRLAVNGELTARETVAEFASGSFPDGMAFDVEGGLWIVSVVTNRIFRLAPDGSLNTLYEDMDAQHVERVEVLLKEGSLTSSVVYERHSSTLLNTSSIAFGGADLRTAYLGCIAGDRLVTFRAPIAGLAPVHWTWG